MTFQAVSADGEVTGNQVFSVPVIPEKKQAKYMDQGHETRTMVFLCLWCSGKVEG